MRLLTLILGALLAQSATTVETSLSGRVETLGTTAPVALKRQQQRRSK